MKAATISRPGHARDGEGSYAVQRDVWAGWGSLILLLLIAIAIPVGTAVWVDRMGAFTALEVPWWTPRLEAWAALGLATYAVMAIGAWLIVRQRDVTILGRWAMVPFETQLALGALAAIALFGFQVPGPALALLIVQAGAVAMTAMRFFYLSRPATWMMVIALGAVTAIMAWTGVVVVMNPEVGP